MKRWLMVLPLAAFLVVAVFLYRGLYLDPAELPSAMILSLIHISEPTRPY